jgi:homoserine O-succinyltransferase
MTLLLDSPSPSIVPDVVKPSAGGVRRAQLADRDAPALDIGLLNNMPDAALRATERQFMRILNAAAGRGLVRLHFLSLPAIERSRKVMSRIDGLYSPIADLSRLRLDGLIVTGTEPRAATLPQEPYWRALTEIVDWAKDHTVSTIWSCLAAHAAVLHSDGIERRRLAHKCSGVFNCAKMQDDRLTAGLSWPLEVSHSRYNELAEDDLQAGGYRMLTRAGHAGVDMFTKNWRSLFVFFQGHPEYDAESLAREYQRDINRFLGGARDTYPSMPTGYFDVATQASLEAFRERALAERDPALFADCPDVTPRADLAAAQSAAATAIFHNWLSLVAERKAG